MPNSSHKTAAEAFLNLVIAGQIREAYDRHVSPDFRHHNVHNKGDRESLFLAMEAAHVQFPNKVFQIRHSLEDGNLVAVHSSMSLNPDQPEIAVVHLFRFENDLIIEEWDVGQQAPAESLNENGMF